jgi:hypothetical protein
MRKISFAAAVLVGSAALAGTYLLGHGGAAIPTAMAQGAACCPIPAPVTQVVLDGPKFAPKDPARDADSASAAFVCATPAMPTAGYRTIMVQTSACHHPLMPEFSSGQAGFVTQVVPAMPCNTTNLPGQRGTVQMIDATQGASFRLTTVPDAKGACPTDVKVTIVGVR